MQATKQFLECDHQKDADWRNEHGAIIPGCDHLPSRCSQNRLCKKPLHKEAQEELITSTCAPARGLPWPSVRTVRRIFLWLITLLALNSRSATAAKGRPPATGCASLDIHMTRCVVRIRIPPCKSHRALSFFTPYELCAGRKSESSTSRRSVAATPPVVPLAWNCNSALSSMSLSTSPGCSTGRALAVRKTLSSTSILPSAGTKLDLGAGRTDLHSLPSTGSPEMKMKATVWPQSRALIRLQSADQITVVCHQKALQSRTDRTDAVDSLFDILHSTDRRE